MKENDYYGHYKAFVKELNSKPDQTLQIYCRRWCGVAPSVYWMRGITLSLKTISDRIARTETAVRMTITQII